MQNNSDKYNQFFNMKSFSDVANLLGVSESELNYVLYLIEPKYFVFEIPKKSGGNRKISAPNNRLKFLQYRLNEILQNIYDPPKCVYGFVQGRNIIENGKAHKKKRYVFNIDLQNFFPSIHFGRVKGLFINPPYNLPERVALIISRICCEYDGLPQGAPTSPTISNMICRKMDGQLRRLAQKHHCFYTRYADDITFSTSMPTFPSALAHFLDGELCIGDELAHLISNNGFNINPNKIKLRTPNQRQEVTGLTVNKFPNISRDYIRQVRVMLNDWKNKGPDEALQRHLTIHSKHRNPHKRSETRFQDIVRGKIEFIGMVRGEKDGLYHKFLSKLATLDPDFAQTYKPLGPPRIFINYAREDENQVEKLYKLLELSGYSPWMDREKIQGGEDWEKKIENAINSSDLFLACLSKTSVNKDGYVQKEIEYALELYGRKIKFPIFIIPVLLEDCALPKRLGKFHGLRYYSKDGTQELIINMKEAIQNLSRS